MLSRARSSVREVRVLVLGDCGVGKTSLVHRLCTGEVLTRASWTIGCHVDVRLHRYKLTGEKLFVEFMDVGGARVHAISRHIFYSHINAIILVFDLTNANSFDNLRCWIRELVSAHRQHPIDQNYAAASRRRRLIDRRRLHGVDADSPPTAAMQLGQMPVLIVGTKLDVRSAKRPLYETLYDTVKNLGIDSVFLSNTSDEFDEASLHAFLDRVIQRRFGLASASAAAMDGAGHRRHPSPTSPHSIVDLRAAASTTAAATAALHPFGWTLQSRHAAAASTATAADNAMNSRSRR